MLAPKQTMLNCALVISFMVLVGFSIAKSIQASSTLGLILAIISLSAGIYFVYLLQQLNPNGEQEKRA